MAHLRRILAGQSGAVATIVVMVLTFALVFGVSTHLSQSQGGLDDLRERARQMGLARQAVSEASASVTHALAANGERPDLGLYHAAMARVSRHHDRDIPAVVNVGGSLISTKTLIGSLASAWAGIIPAIHRGEFEEARRIYRLEDCNAKLVALNAAFQISLARIEEDLAEGQHRARLATLFMQVLQLMVGGFCVGVFLTATIRGAMQARARALAVTTANASREQVSRLFEMTDMLQSATDLQDAKQVLKATAEELIPHLGGALYVFSNSRDRLTLSTVWNRDGQSPLPDTISLQQCWSLKRGKQHINVPNSHKLSCEHFEGQACELEIPMIARGEILGLLQIEAPGPDGEARLLEIAPLGSALADAMSLALSNIALRDKLRGQALRDPLTGLYNRRYMEDTLQRIVRLADREHTEVSVIMIDLDHFKRLNDNYGHAKGDSVLRDAAAVLMNQLRDTDVACRYGGEELIVVLPNCGIDMAAQKAERLRAAIEGLSEPNGASVTASFGVSSIPGTAAATKDLLTSADAALYRAKQDGRNRVCKAPAGGKAGDAAPQGGATVHLIAAE